MNNYFLEIGVEEYPSRYIESCKEQLLTNITNALHEENLTYASIRVESTPRRFALWIENPDEAEKEREEIVRGPSAKIAFDSEGNPSKALLGFMGSKKITLEDTYVEDDYVYAKIRKEAKSIPDLLSQIVPNAIRKISIPRSMRWGGKNLLFARPIRWLVSLYNDTLLPFDLEEIPVSNITRGHRYLGSSRIVIEKIAEYEDLLEENGVIVSEKKRRDRILRGLNRLAREKGGVPLADEELLQEVVHIVEYPTVFMGRIPEQYLELPREVLITPMKDHQRYFPVENEGKLLPYFLSVRNGDDLHMENVIEGNEKVLVPRLEDAKFFYLQDLEEDPVAAQNRLSGLMFHEKLGTMTQKTERLKSLVENMGKEMLCGEEVVAHATRAAELSKLDLVSKMVVEFTELQGIMGRIYALEAGENPIVAQAIEEQYLPRVSGGELPKSTVGSLLAMADKVDTIAGLFAIGTTVSGSQDPFGLRRSALGIIDILLKNKIHVDLERSFRDSLLAYVEQQGLVFDYDEIIARISDFFRGRLKQKMREDGIRYDVVSAVLATEDSDLNALYRKGSAVWDFISGEEDDKTITSFMRIASLAEKYDHEPIVNDVLEEADQEMLTLLDRLTEVEDVLVRNYYGEALTILRDMMDSVNGYLDNTMIMVENDVLRGSRLAMLNRLNEVIEKILVPEYIVRD